MGLGSKHSGSTSNMAKQYAKPVHIYFNNYSRPSVPVLRTEENLPPELYRNFTRPITVETFQKISMLNIYVSGKALEEIAPGIKVINELEMGKGSGHWKSIECRLRHYRKSLRNKK